MTDEMREQAAGAEKARWLVPKRWWQLAALALAVGVFVALLFVPTYSGGATLVQVNGTGVLVTLSVPVVVAALPLPWRGSRWQVVSIVSTVLLWVFCLIGILTIGVALVPAAICALVGAAMPVGPPRPGVTA